MRSMRGTEMTFAGLDRRGGFWRAALAGLTPQVVGVVAVLLFIRGVSASLDKVVLAVNHGDLTGWGLRLVYAYLSLLIQAAPMLIGIIATGNLGPQRGSKRVAALGLAVVLSAAIGAMLRMTIMGYFGIGSGWERVFSYVTYTWPRYIVVGGMLTVVGEFYRREIASVKAMHEAEADRAAFERQMAEARLQVLRAQIEPHFLFNTLANVRRLYDKDRVAGRAMLENLMRYLEIALPRMRDNEATLEGDAGLVEAFLRIQQIRMGRRLAFGIDIPPPLRAHPVPPMMLLTLVENAVKHGLNRSPHGGLVRISARVVGGQLAVCVADTGVGFEPGSGPGTGLANIQARLAAQFGDRAALSLENNELGGVTATIALPFELGAAVL
jgi:signal transduction histidine kinase